MSTKAMILDTRIGKKNHPIKKKKKKTSFALEKQHLYLPCSVLSDVLSNPVQLEDKLGPQHCPSQQPLDNVTTERSKTA